MRRLRSYGTLVYSVYSITIVCKSIINLYFWSVFGGSKGTRVFPGFLLNFPRKRRHLYHNEIHA